MKEEEKKNPNKPQNTLALELKAKSWIPLWGELPLKLLGVLLGERLTELGNLVLDYCKVREKGALQGPGGALSFIFLTKYPMNNEYWLRAFSITNGLVCTACQHGEFLTLLRRWDDKVRGWRRPLHLCQSRAGDSWTPLPRPPAVLYAVPGDFQHGAESHSWDLEVSSSSTSGVRVGSGLLPRAHDHAQTLAGPEATDVGVTSDTRIFPFSLFTSKCLFLQLLWPVWLGEDDVHQLIPIVRVPLLSLLIFWVGVVPALTPVSSQPANTRPVLACTKTMASARRWRLWSLVRYLEAERKRRAVVGWGGWLFRGWLTLGVPTVTGRFTGLCIWGAFQLMFLTHV